MSAGRPLRFLVVTLGGWTAVRVALLWPTIDSLPSLVEAIVPPVAAATRDARPSALRLEPTATIRLAAPSPIVWKPATPSPIKPSIPTMPPLRPAITPPETSPPPPRQPPPLRPAPLASPPDRLAGSAWLILRGGRNDAVAGGQLGASQMGARVTYTLVPRVALAARVSAPLRGRGGEVALGVDWQPIDLPVHVIAEQRVAVDGGLGGTALFAAGGVDPTPVALGITLDAYLQAGGIHRDGRTELFADGAVRLARPVARIGSTRLDLGGGAWGGAQRGAARLDVGPSATLIVPVKNRAVRVALDWRHRVAGRARPDTGFALSLGGDF